ncbi:MFS transporter [Roseomonas sp. SSH11]|uniref:MFS transporter n=1 Tax=Pararoseomonas baculiformis TaxID=2820812 RepID=A0ABS4AGH6_9PROT|nr:MFS transporter [Pararoseomonas baculiformis]MBP0445628.1 MFS transporter [Pararoseomonas baculiformis]
MKRHVRLIAAGAVGNAIEFYDFLIFGYLSLHIGRAFFPAGDGVAAILASLAAFAVGMLMRPLGGLIFGLLADRGNRLRALVASAAMIAVPTFLIGLLPGYATIGVFAPIILVLLRVIQGLSLGGEFPASLAYLVENAPPGRRALFGSFASAGAVSGMLLGTATCYVTSSLLAEDAMQEWGWRIPFLLSAVLTIAAVLLRRALLRDDHAPVRASLPMATLLRENLRGLVGVFSANILTGTASFVVFMFTVPWLMQTAGMAYDDALAINLHTLLLLFMALPVAGLLADRFGHRRTVMLGVAGLLLGAHPLLAMMRSGDPLLDSLGEAGLALAFALLVASMGPIMADAFPSHARVTGIAIAYGSAVGIFGGLSPMMVQYLMGEAHDVMAPAHVVMGASLISGVSLLLASQWQARGAEAPQAARPDLAQSARAHGAV